MASDAQENARDTQVQTASPLEPPLPHPPDLVKTQYHQIIKYFRGIFI